MAVHIYATLILRGLRDCLPGGCWPAQRRANVGAPNAFPARDRARGRGAPNLALHPNDPPVPVYRGVAQPLWNSSVNVWWM